VRQMSYSILSSISVEGIMMRVGGGILYRPSLVSPYRLSGYREGEGGRYQYGPPLWGLP
jgi:hypothetical protein